MISILRDLATELFGDPRVLAVTRGLFLLVVGLAAARLVSRGIHRLVGGRATAQVAMLVRRGVFYGIALLALVTALDQIGFDLSVLLGAAGILTVAIGFASQTAASNLISGLFLIAEQPFVVGDVVRIGAVTGEVIAIDLLSVKIRTFDNLLVRIPSEMLLKGEITNTTRFPIRRCDIFVGVHYGTDLRLAFDLLTAVAASHPLCLDDPPVLLQIRQFGESSIDLQFSAWATRENYLKVKTELHRDVQEAFAAHGIEIPFPQRTLTSGPEGLTVRIDTGETAARPGGGSEPA